MRVLIVEDEKKVAGFIKKGLEEETYAVDVAYDGEEGLYLGKEGQYDLIILEHVLEHISNPLIALKNIHKLLIHPIKCLSFSSNILFSFTFSIYINLFFYTKFEKCSLSSFTILIF